jgi:hypothetical protein
MPAPPIKRLLLVSQVYVPDPAAVGQYMAAAAEEMVRQGWQVRVLTSDRGYEDPSIRFPRKGTVNGVELVRLPFSSLGKRSLLHRLAGQLVFCLQAVILGLLGPRPSLLLITTSPPMGSLVGVLLGWLRRMPVAWWVMDINPDQALATGAAKPGGLAARIFDACNRQALRRARVVIVLDRFMAARMALKEPAAAARIRVLPPWPLETRLARLDHAANPFRREHGLEEKFVIEYSGNHSPVHPLTTLLGAAIALRDDPRFVFVFIGGGAGKRDVDDLIREQSPSNIRSLPYQPLDRICYSLSAADLQVVSMGPAMVGIVHPCKCYGAMALAKPILYLGPEESHLGEMIRSAGCGWRVDHGDVAGLVQLLLALVVKPAAELATVGTKGRAVIEATLGERILLPEFCRLIQGP